LFCLLLYTFEKMGRLFKDRTPFLRDKSAYTAQLSIFRALTMFGDGKHVYRAENTVVQQTLFRLSNSVFPSNVFHRMKKNALPFICRLFQTTENIVYETQLLPARVLPSRFAGEQNMRKMEFYKAAEKGDKKAAHP